MKQLCDSVIKFIDETGYLPVVGAEVEFFCDSERIVELVEGVDREKGENQYEVRIAPRRDPFIAAYEIVKLRRHITDICEGQGVRADFESFKEPFGSALHIHISLLDNKGKNVLAKSGEEESQIMLYAVGGLLSAMAGDMKYFCSSENSYQRLKYGTNSPKTISWGGNNRTTALRLPATTVNPDDRRIEHRVSCASADPYLVINAILNGIRFGITRKIMPSSPKIYGDASLMQYVEEYGLEYLYDLLNQR